MQSERAARLVLERSDFAKLNSTISGNSGYKAGPRSVWQEGVSDVEEEASGRRTRRTHDPAFKARVVLVASREDRPVAELCEQFELHPNQISEWKRHLSSAQPRSLTAAPGRSRLNLGPMDAKIGQWALENDFLEGALTKAGLLSEKP